METEGQMVGGGPGRGEKEGRTQQRQRIPVPSLVAATRVTPGSPRDSGQDWNQGTCIQGFLLRGSVGLTVRACADSTVAGRPLSPDTGGHPHRGVWGRLTAAPQDLLQESSSWLRGLGGAGTGPWWGEAGSIAGAGRGPCLPGEHRRAPLGDTGLPRPSHLLGPRLTVCQGPVGGEGPRRAICTHRVLPLGAWETRGPGRGAWGEAGGRPEGRPGASWGLGRRPGGAGLPHPRGRGSGAGCPGRCRPGSPLSCTCWPGRHTLWGLHSTQSSPSTATQKWPGLQLHMVFSVLEQFLQGTRPKAGIREKELSAPHPHRGHGPPPQPRQAGAFFRRPVGAAPGSEPLSPTSLSPKASGLRLCPAFSLG